MSKNIGFKNGYAIGLIKSGLSKEGKKAIDSLSAEEQIRLANLQKNNDPTLNEEVRKAIGMDSNFTSIQEKVKLTIKKALKNKE